MQVGDTIYRFDMNRRVYRKAENGQSTGGPIYSEHFEPRTIGSETKQSWLITDGYGVIKVNKKTMKQAGNNGWGGWQWFSAADMEANVWEHDHRHKIRDLLNLALAEKLKQVAEILGYKPHR